MMPTRRADTRRARHPHVGVLIVHMLAAQVSVAAGQLDAAPGIRQFDTHDGLPSRYVTALAEDGEGRLWVGTNAGLARYDGTDWQQMPLPVSGVLSIARSRDFVVAIGTEQDAYSFVHLPDGKTSVHVWTPFEHPYLRSPADSVRRGVYAICERPSDGALWFGTPTGAKLYTVFEWIPADTGRGLPSDTVRAVATAGGDAAWLGTEHGLFLWRADPVKQGRISQPSHLPQELVRGPIHALLIDSSAASRTLWVGTPSRLYQSVGDRWERMPLPGSINCLARSCAGVYAGSSLALYRFSSSGAWEMYASSEPISALASSARGGVWIGTHGGGLRYLPEAALVQGQRSTGPAGPVTAMAAASDSGLLLAVGGELWHAAAEQASRPVGVSYLVLRTDRWSRTNAVIVAPDASIWLGTDHGAFHVRNGTILRAFDAVGEVRTLVLDHEGVVWLGAESGVWRIYPGTYHIEPWRRDAPNPFYPIGETPDAPRAGYLLWMGTPHGVYAIRGRRLISLERIGGRLLGQVRTGTVTPNGVLWFGDNEGHLVEVAPGRDAGEASVADGTTLAREATVFAGDNGEIRSIAVGNEGTIWAATDAGVVAWRTLDGRTRIGISTRYGADRGMPAVWAVMPFGMDAVVAGTDDGLVLLRPDRDPPQTRIVAMPGVVAPTGELVAVVRAADRWKQTPDEALRILWRLDGGDWSLAEENDHVALASIPPGTHRIEVAGMDGDLNIDPTPAAATFVVERPVWRRLEVTVPAILLLVATAWLALLLRAGKGCTTPWAGRSRDVS